MARPRHVYAMAHGFHVGQLVRFRETYRRGLPADMVATVIGIAEEPMVKIERPKVRVVWRFYGAAAKKPVSAPVTHATQEWWTADALEPIRGSQDAQSGGPK